VLAIGRVRLALVWTASVQPLRPHEARDALASTVDAVVAQGRMHARAAIHAASGDTGRLELRRERVVGLRPRARGTATPGVRATDGDLQRLPHDPHGELTDVTGDEGVFHGWPREKMPSAFLWKILCLAEAQQRSLPLPCPRRMTCLTRPGLVSG
jgi:hypothetical protein